MQGLWTFIGVETHTDLWTSLDLYKDTNCKVDMTSNVLSSSGGVILYESEGTFGVCLYPDPHTWSYDSNKNTINGYLVVDSVNSNRMRLKSIGSDIYQLYNKTPIVWGNTVTINWEVELTSPYPADNQVLIAVSTESVSPLSSLQTSIPITTTQTSYSGSETFSINSYIPSISIKLFDISGGLTTPNTIQLTAKLSGYGYKSNSTLSTYCIGETGANLTNCRGYNPAGVTLSMITWH